MRFKEQAQTNTADEVVRTVRVRVSTSVCVCVGVSEADSSDVVVWGEKRNVDKLQKKILTAGDSVRSLAVRLSAR